MQNSDFTNLWVYSISPGNKCSGLFQLRRMVIFYLYAPNWANCEGDCSQDALQFRTAYISKLNNCRRQLSSSLCYQELIAHSHQEISHRCMVCWQQHKFLVPGSSIDGAAVSFDISYIKRQSWNGEGTTWNHRTIREVLGVT